MTVYLIVSLLIGLFLFRLGYYVGKQIGQTHPIREYLDNARASVRAQAD